MLTRLYMYKYMKGTQSPHSYCQLQTHALSFNHLVPQVNPSTVKPISYSLQSFLKIWCNLYGFSSNSNTV